ncbi:diguanylate cyclase domain-containing protein [Euzebya sp.]|uniref:diguanylate cyclase domain-containing protein n=1 Tax=Euzebya sp. TaxID=1971409 RepID=UPI003510EF5E
MSAAPDLPGWLVDGLLERLLTDAPLPLGVLDLDLRHLAVNHALASLYRQDPAAVAGRTPSEVLGDLGRQVEDRCRGVLLRARASVGHVVSGRPRLAPPATPDVHWQVDLTPLPRGSAGIGAILLTATDVTARTRAMRTLNDQRRELAHQAGHDALTGLANRAHLHEALAADVAAGRPVVVHLIDLDGFKHINDGHGHAAGDHVLAVVGRRLAAAVRPADLACRYGGDEFVVRTVAGAADGLAERLVATIAQPIEWEGRELAIGASIGVAALGPDDDVDALLGRADMAMYADKRTRP